MIDFSLPEESRPQIQMTEAVARDVMRPAARHLDEHEHARPTEFVKVMWPVMAGQQQANLERARIKAAKAENGHSEPDPGEKKRTRNYFLNYLHVIEMLAWGDVGQYLCTPTPGLGGTAIESVGTLEQKERFLSRYADPKSDPVWGAMAITEPGAGSDNSAIATTAVLDEESNEWVLNGEKIFVTSGGLSLNESNGLVVVWATVDKTAGRAGIKSFIVESNTPGVEVAKAEIKHGIRASDTVVIVLKDARIPYDNILGSPEVRQKEEGNTKGFKGAMQTFNASRPSVAASAVGVARAALEFTKEKLAEAGIEIRYDAPAHELTALERDVIEMESTLKATWLLTIRAGAMLDQSLSNALEASMCKAKAGKASTEIAQKCVEILGPMGYSREWLVEKFMRDSKIADIYEGTHQINQLIVARQILGYTGKELR